MNWLKSAIALFAGIYLVIAFTHGVHIDYALIDDYNDWKQLRLLDSPGEFIAQRFISITPDVRYRPGHEALQFLLYRLFLKMPGVQHALRIVMKFGIFLLGLLIIKRVTQQDRMAREQFWLAAYVFTCLFLLHPMAPEVRLTPQEIPLLLVFGAITAALIRLHDKAYADARVSPPWRDRFGLLLGVALLSTLKENSLALMLPVLLVLLLRERQVPLSLASVARLLPLVTIIAYTALRAYLNSLANYGHIEEHSLTRSLLQFGAPWAHMFLFAACPVWLVLGGWPVAVIARQSLPLRTVRHWICSPAGVSSRAFASGFLLCCLLSITAIGLFYPHRTARYFLPNLFLVALLLGLTTTIWYEIALKQRKKLALILFLGLLFWFPILNLYNFQFQWASQVAARRAENSMLTELSARAASGVPIMVCGDSEFELNVATHLKEYRPATGKKPIDCELIVPSRCAADSGRVEHGIYVAHGFMPVGCPHPLVFQDQESSVFAQFFFFLDRWASLFQSSRYHQILIQLGLVAPDSFSEHGNYLLIDAGSPCAIKPVPWFLCVSDEALVSVASMPENSPWGYR